MTERYGSNQRLMPSEEMAAVARQFLDAELVPRLEALASQARGAGLSADVRVGEELSRGPGRHLERAGIAVSRHLPGRSKALPVAELEFEYRGDLKFEALHYTKIGRDNSTVFDLAGTPLDLVESVVESFREDIGVEV